MTAAILVMVGFSEGVRFRSEYYEEVFHVVTEGNTLG